MGCSGSTEAPISKPSEVPPQPAAICEPITTKNVPETSLQAKTSDTPTPEVTKKSAQQKEPQNNSPNIQSPINITQEVTSPTIQQKVPPASRVPSHSPNVEPIMETELIPDSRKFSTVFDLGEVVMMNALYLTE